MGAPKGNEFWKLRSKHGRDKLFATPELLWDAAIEYFKWCNENPLVEMKVINSSKEGIVDHPVSKVRAYTLTGLCLYLGCSEAYIRQFKASLKGKDDELSKDFSTVITRIEETIYTQQFANAAVDLLNPNIIARSLGLADKKQHSNDPDNPMPSNGTSQMNISLPDGTNIDDYLDRLKK